MKKLIALGISVVLSAELAALSLHDRRFVLGAAGVAVLFALVNVRQVLGRGAEPSPPTIPNALEESMAKHAAPMRSLMQQPARTSGWSVHSSSLLEAYRADHLACTRDDQRFLECFASFG